MISTGTEEVMRGETEGTGGQDENILVSVRLRPLNDKETTRNDISDWECINNTTIVCRHGLPERSMLPSAYTFDRVFGWDCPTKQVYEQGAKDVALSALSGINSSIFAYGQTSSGKTYTMSGVTEYAIADIFQYIDRCKDREFVLKFSAIEIYNEAVRDLLSSDSTPLRLLDDPERGTVVERLTEEILRDQNHLEELLSICEAQRQIGETSLNETSSRSHQILRLTVESSAREYGAENSSSLAAAVNFVDLAGSERASQTLSAGARLKEGSHINRSLLTLGTVIRKLSKGRNGHVPYRDSKLTRILQNSLGGNARTAIICTMSPARSHVEQSKNTLFFASCAKEVSTNARINFVVSDKILVRQLQRELARMESELRNLGSASTSADSTTMLLTEKEQLIQKMEKQIIELTWQRDLAQSRVETLLQSAGEDQVSKTDEYSVTDSVDATYLTCNLSKEFHEAIAPNSDKHYLELSDNPEENFLLDDSTPQFVGPDPCLGWEEIAARTDEESKDLAARTDEESKDIAARADDSIPQFVGANLCPGWEESALRTDQESKDIAVRTDDSTLQFVGPDPYPGWEETAVRTDEESKNIVVRADDSTPQFVAPGPCPGWEETAGRTDEESKDIGKQDQFIEMESPSLKREEEEADMFSSAYEMKKDDLSMKWAKSEETVSSPRTGDRHSSHINMDYDALKEKVQKLQKTINLLVGLHPLESSPSPESCFPSPGGLPFSRSRSCREILVSAPSAIWSEKEQKESRTPVLYGKDFTRPLSFPRKQSEFRYASSMGHLSRKASQTSISSTEAESTISSFSVDADSNKESDADNSSVMQDFVAALNEIAKLKSENASQVSDVVAGKNETGKQPENTQITKELGVGNTCGTHGAVAGVNEMAKLESQKQSDDDSVAEAASKINKSKEIITDIDLGTVQCTTTPDSDWTSEFERQQRKIIELWVLCSVPLIHRTYFFLLFKGDPSDSVYMEVELRRLSFLKGTFSHGSDESRDSAKALSREREMLSRQIKKKFSRREREKLYQKWGINLKTKLRGLQLTQRLWTETKDMEHIKESAALVAKLIGLVEPSQAPKEIFGLTFSPRSTTWRSFSRKSSITIM